MNIQRVTYGFILFGAFLWCGALIAAPYLASSSSPLAEFMYRCFHPLCHQLPERSFHLFGEKLAVCSRCTSIYFGFLLGVVVYPLARKLTNTEIPHRNILFLAVAPMVIDVLLDMFGIHDSGFVTRTCSGLLFGCVAPFFVLPAAIEGTRQLSTNKPIIINEQSERNSQCVKNLLS